LNQENEAYDLGMSANNPALLLPDVMSKVASLGPSALAAVHKFLLRLELAQLTEEIQDEAEALRQAGKLEPDLIAAAIREHRKNHPYAV
jgi:hypothetical protein